MSTYTSRHRILFASLAVVFMLFLAVAIVQLRKEPDHLEWWLLGAIGCWYAAGSVRIAATGTSWSWFERAGGAQTATRLAGWGLLILASLALVWYNGR
jgi:membrane-bound metal-dependent hydrolase YbcI (DUF457 family)